MNKLSAVFLAAMVSLGSIAAYAADAPKDAVKAEVKSEASGADKAKAAAEKKEAKAKAAAEKKEAKAKAAAEKKEAKAKAAAEAKEAKPKAAADTKK